MLVSWTTSGKEFALKMFSKSIFIRISTKKSFIFAVATTQGILESTK